MVKKHMKHSDGKYHIDGKTFDELIGSRAKVGPSSWPLRTSK